MKTNKIKILTTAILMFCFLFIGTSYSQRLEKNVPVAVTENFQKKFPNKEPVWFSEIQGRYDKKLVYEARFMFDNRYTKVFFENEGILIAIATTIEQSELPEAVRKYMKENYPTLPIAESIVVEHIKNGTHYEVGAYVDNALMVKTFNKDGVYLKTVER